MLLFVMLDCWPILMSSATENVPEFVTVPTVTMFRVDNNLIVPAVLFIELCCPTVEAPETVRVPELLVKDANVTIFKIPVIETLPELTSAVCCPIVNVPELSVIVPEFTQGETIEPILKLPEHVMEPALLNDVCWPIVAVRHVTLLFEPTEKEPVAMVVRPAFAAKVWAEPAGNINDPPLFTDNAPFSVRFADKVSVTDVFIVSLLIVIATFTVGCLDAVEPKVTSSPLKEGYPVERPQFLESLQLLLVVLPPVHV